MFSRPRTFYRVLAGALAYGWVVYVVSGGSPPMAAMGMAKIIPVLLAVVAVWAAAVEEEAILWVMSGALTLFGLIFVARGALAVTWSGIALLIITALSREIGRSGSQPLSPERRRQLR